MIGVRLGEELEQRIAAISSSLKRPKSGLIREAIEAKLEEWEDLQVVLESYQDKGRRWTLAEMAARYDLNDDDAQ